MQSQLTKGGSSPNPNPNPTSNHGSKGGWSEQSDWGQTAFGNYGPEHGPAALQYLQFLISHPGFFGNKGALKVALRLIARATAVERLLPGGAFAKLKLIAADNLERYSHSTTHYLSQMSHQDMKLLLTIGSNHSPHTDRSDLDRRPTMNAIDIANSTIRHSTDRSDTVIPFMHPKFRDTITRVRCVFFDRNLHSRMPLVSTPARLKQASV
jgi:hypothetical protein